MLKGSVRVPQCRGAGSTEPAVAGRASDHIHTHVAARTTNTWILSCAHMSRAIGGFYLVVWFPQLQRGIWKFDQGKCDKLYFNVIVYLGSPSTPVYICRPVVSLPSLQHSFSSRAASCIHNIHMMVSVNVFFFFFPVLCHCFHCVHKSHTAHQCWCFTHHAQQNANLQFKIPQCGLVLTPLLSSG